MSRRRKNRVVVLFIFLTLCIGGSSFAQDVEFDTALDQAKVYMKKKWYRQATKELRRAIATPEGRESFDAHVMLAQACFGEHDIGCAIKMTEEARGLARSPEERRSAQSVLDYLARAFGKVEFQAGPGELSEGYLELEALDPIPDKNVKRYYQEKVETLADQRRTLPWIMYLPAVRYSLYGQEFTVEGGKEITIDAGFNAENSKPKPPKKPPPPRFDGLGIALDLRLGGGTVVARTGGSTPGPVADIQIGYTFGEMLGAAAFVKFNHDQGFKLPDEESVGSPNDAMTYGLLGTMRLPSLRVWKFIPVVSLGYGLGDGPAARLTGCRGALDEETGEEIVICDDTSEGQEGGVNMTLDSKIQGPVAGVELAMERRKAKSILMFRFGVQAHYALIGNVTGSTGRYIGYNDDSTGQYVQQDSSLLEYRVEGGGFHPLRIEVLAGLNFTF